uniref:G-patch domain-containing protein n=1 Tax=Tetradesmus obliquus TaxID=3088 RepID=A0A383V8E5_TETOB|eukprot:jgi/Sobl393_1/2100/SZX61230.1
MASASTLPNLYQGVEKESFGYKLLANFGWKEGQGLGANKQGIKEHLKVKKKQDALGVGAAEQAHKLRDWTTGMVGYDAILTGLKEISRGGPSSSSDEDESSEQGHSSGYDSDSDTSGGAPAKPAAAAAAAAAAKQDSKKKSKKAAAEAAAAKQKKRGKKQQGKAAADADVPAAKRAKKSHSSSSSSSSSESDSGSDCDSDSDTDAQPAAAAGVPKTVSRVKAASHLGRYQKREKAKTVRNYSANDLAAILGLPGSAPPVANGEGAAGWAAAAAVSNPAGAGAGGSSSSSDSGSSSDSDSEAGGEQRLRPSTPPGSDSPPGRSQQRGLGDGKAPNLVVDEELQPVSDDPEEAAGQRVWWRSLFVRAGRTGGAAPAAAAAAAAAGSGKQRINISGFQEDDQTNLYMQAHEGATKGKQGLGRSSMPKKVAGTRWQGKKTRLGSDSEDEAEEEQQQQQEGDAAAGEAAAAAAAAAAARTYVKNGITIVMPVKRGQQQQQQQQQQQGEAAASGKEQKKDKKQKQSKQQQQQQEDAAGSSKPKREKKQKQEEAAAAAVGSSKKRKQQQADEAAAAAAAGSSQKKSKKAKQEQQQQRQQQQQQQVPQVKWAKLAAKILEGAPKKRMRVQKLHRKVVAAAGYDVEAPGVDTEQLFAQMLRKLKKAEGLAVCEKYVGLAG